MSKVIQEASQELNAKLVRAGYLQPALRHDADAITTPIARLKEDLRGGGDDEGPKRAQKTAHDSVDRHLRFAWRVISIRGTGTRRTVSKSTIPPISFIRPMPKRPLRDAKT